MKHTFRRMTALFLVLLMTASLLASCSKGQEKADETADTYLGENVDLELAENETLMDIIEVDGALRATVGVTSEELTAKYDTDYGTPYKTEYRYYDMAFVEDTAKREPTASFHQIAQASDPSLNLTIGGEPYLYTDENGVETSYGVRYYIYKDGEKTEHILNPRGENAYGKYTQYGARANIVMVNDVPYAWIDYTEYNFEVFVNDHFLKTTEISPDMIYGIYGLLDLKGSPNILVHAEQMPLSEGYTYFCEPEWEATLLVPLSPQTVELKLEGIEIEGEPSGGAFNDGRASYYLCNSELWQIDGKSSVRISDLIYCGVSSNSDVRTVRAISDGRILVVADGGLIELSVADSVIPNERSIYTIGVVNYVNGQDLAIEAAKANSNIDGYKFAVKEFKDVTKMNLALLSGEVDMIITNDQFLLNNYIKQGFLAPLDEVAPELFEEGVLIDNIVDATRVDGVCYYLPREFMIWGRADECRILEEEPTFANPQEYYDFIREKSPGYFTGEKAGILEHFVSNIDEWIDWESNTCHFDDGSFEAALEFCNEGVSSGTIPDYSVPTYSNLMYMTDLLPVSYFTDIETAKEYIENQPNGNLDILPTTDKEAWGWVCFPLPTKEGGGYEIFAEHFYAVADKEESREAAREFLTYRFIEDVRKSIAPDDSEENYLGYVEGMNRIPINQAECERYIGRNLSWDGEDKETRLPIEQRRYEDAWKIIRQADHLRYFRNAVFDVMVEEAYRYFAGDITAKQAAEYVQNRISIYLAEQS